MFPETLKWAFKIRACSHLASFVTRKSAFLVKFVAIKTAATVA